MGSLSGIETVEMGGLAAGPAAAAVVKIENPAGGGPLREKGAFG